MVYRSSWRSCFVRSSQYNSIERQYIVYTGTVWESSRVQQCLVPGAGQPWAAFSTEPVVRIVRENTHTYYSISLGMMVMVMMVLKSKLLFPTLPVSVCPAEDRLLPSATGPPAAARLCHARPTWQHKVLSAKERAPTPNSANGGRLKEPSRKDFFFFNTRTRIVFPAFFYV